MATLVFSHLAAGENVWCLFLKNKTKSRCPCFCKRVKPFETVTAVYTKELDLRIPGTVRWRGIAAFLGINLSNLHLLWCDVLGFFCIPEDFKFTMDCQGWKMLLLAARRRTCSVFSWRCAEEVLTCFFFTFTISFANESPHNTVDFGLTFLILWSKKKHSSINDYSVS